MALSTYSELKAAVARQAGRRDIASGGSNADLVADWIAAAEAQMRRALRVRQMIARDDAFTIDGEYVDLPADFAGVRAFSLSTTLSVPLTYVTPDKADDLASSTTGQPAYYSIVGGEFRFIPAPDASYSAALSYWQTIPALSDAEPSNWLLTACPDAYLYGTLTHFATWAQDERGDTWAGLYASAVSDLKAADIIDSHGAVLRPQPSVVV